jgi:act minimal PKS acyl carrier protein
MQRMTVPALMEILDRAGGGAESLDLSTDVSEVDLEELGYESLAILETAGVIEREYGVTLDEAALFDARTPQGLVAVVNDALASATA